MGKPFQVEEELRAVRKFNGIESSGLNGGCRLNRVKGTRVGKEGLKGLLVGHSNRRSCAYTGLSCKRA